MKREVKCFYYLLHPRPVVIVCCERNIMACSWITPVSEDPPMIALSIWKESHTHKLIETKKEFTINIPSINLIKQVWIAGSKSGRDVNKIELTGLRTSPSKKVNAPIIEDCIGHLECKLFSSIDTGECTVFIAEVLMAYAEEELLEGEIWSEKANVLLHSGGRVFTKPSKGVWMK